MKSIIVKIYGRISSGKSPIALKIARAVEDSGKSFYLNDHFLFSLSEDYDSRLKEVTDHVDKHKPDVAILVIGTGSNDSPFRIEITPSLIGPLQIVSMLANKYGTQTYSNSNSRSIHAMDDNHLRRKFSTILPTVHIDAAELCRRLSEIEKAQRESVPEGWELPETLQPSYADMVLDLMGVPEDNAMEMIALFGDKHAHEHPDFYCRDHLTNLWHDMLSGSVDVQQFVEAVLLDK